MLFQETKNDSFPLSENAKAHLLETTRWTKFLAILGLVFVTLMLLGALTLLTSGTLERMPLFAQLGVVWYIIFSLLMMAIYVYPILMLFQFSVKTRKGIVENNSQFLEDGLKAQKNMFRFMGILSIVSLSLYLLLMLSSLFFALV